MIFEAGQEVTLVHVGFTRDLELARVDVVTHGGKRVVLEGGAGVFDENGYRKEGKFVRGTRIRPTTDEDRNALERVALWKRIDRAIGPWWVRSDERDKTRAAITTDLLRQVVALLEPKGTP